MVTPRKGMRFTHTRWIDSRYSLAEIKQQHRGQLFEVTRIARGTVYIRPVYVHSEGTPEQHETLGAGFKLPVEKFAADVHEVVA